MANRLKVSPSTHPPKSLPALMDYIKEIELYADMLHCDIMDGAFVPDHTFSYETITVLKQHTHLPLDVHLMVKNPKGLVEDFVKAGADILTIHAESFVSIEELKECLSMIKNSGIFCGISIKPSTSVNSIFDVLPICDLVLVMSVEPGKSGQTFLPSALNKINELKQIKISQGLSYEIEVDGGVNNLNIASIKQSGADIVVSGNYLFLSKDKKTAIESLQI